MRVVYLAAGAAGMYCGSCLRDNRLVATLRKQGRDIVLIPLYTPLRTDETDVSEHAVFFGGINVYLQEKFALFRKLPAAIDRVLDRPALLRGVGRFATNTHAEDLGALTLAVLRGEHGPLRKEVERLIEALRHYRPTLINLPNLMFIGIAAEMKAALGAAVACTLGGEDLFLDQLPEREREEAFSIIRSRAEDVNAFIATTRYYADHCVEHFGLPAERMHDAHMGIHVSQRPIAHPPTEPFTICYVGRICPEKGLAGLCEALAILARQRHNVRVRAAGHLRAADRAYLDLIQESLARKGLSERFSYVGEVSLDEKLALLDEAHVFSMPTIYHEAKGLPVLEALERGVPVIQPRHGSFPELVEQTAGGVLVEPGNAGALADAIRSLMQDEPRRRTLGQTGRAAVIEKYAEDVMAEQTWALYESILKRSTS